MAVADAIIVIVVGTVGVADAVIAIIVGTVGGVVVLATATAVVMVAVVLTVAVVLATAAIMVVVLAARLTKLATVMQVAISVADGVETVVNATAWLWLMVTMFALGPVPIRQAMEMLGRDYFPQNLAKL